MNFDLVVVGNGAIGHAVAHAVSLESPGMSIAVVGKASRPLGASVAAGAMLGAFSEITATLLKSSAGREKLSEALHASRLWPEWLEGLNQSLPPQHHVRMRPGTFIIHNTVGGTLDSENFDAIHRTLLEKKELFEDVDPQTIPGLNPWAMARPLRALYIPGESSVESDKLLAAYVASATASRAIQLIDDCALSVETSGSRLIGVRTLSNGTLCAGKVVLCNGIGVQALLDQLPPLKRRIPRLFSGGGNSLIFDPAWCYGGKSVQIVPHVVRTPNRSLACGLHMIPRGDSHVYIGATNYLSLLPWSKPNLSDMHFLIECAIEQLNQDFVWAQLVKWNTGNRPVTVDCCPIIGETSLEGLWVLSGTFRDGLHMSPLLAQQVTREIVYGERSTPQVFRPERPPITMSRQEAVAEVLKHYQAGWCEHRAVSSTKMGAHYVLPRVVEAVATKWYEESEGPYVLPPEFFPLVEGDPANTEFFRSYYAEVRAEWAGAASK